MSKAREKKCVLSCDLNVAVLSAFLIVCGREFHTLGPADDIRRALDFVRKKARLTGLGQMIAGIEPGRVGAAYP